MIKQLSKCVLTMAASALLLIPATAPLAATPPTANSFNPQQTQDIQRIVHDYLVQHPEVLIEASRVLQKQEAQKAQAAAQQAEKDALGAIAANKQALFNDPNTPIMGNKNGDVMIVEFFDYQCGHCKAMAPVLDDLIKDNSNLKVILKDWPIFGEDSNYAAEASLAVAKQDPSQYLAFHKALLAAQGALSQDQVKQIATSLGIDFAALSPHIDSADIQQQMKSNADLADTLKLFGTPAFIIANRALTQFRFVPGAIPKQQLQTLINQVKAGAPTVPATN